MQETLSAGPLGVGIVYREQPSFMGYKSFGFGRVGRELVGRVASCLPIKSLGLVSLIVVSFPRLLLPRLESGWVVGHDGKGRFLPYAVSVA